MNSTYIRDYQHLVVDLFYRVRNLETNCSLCYDKVTRDLIETIKEINKESR